MLEKLIAYSHHFLLCSLLFVWSVALFMDVVEYSFKNSEDRLEPQSFTHKIVAASVSCIRSCGTRDA